MEFTSNDWTQLGGKMYCGEEGAVVNMAMNMWVC
jgi:hypothetical protein